MKASVQYNDLIGSAAADVEDWYNNSLQYYLENTFKSYDGERYSCRGCSAFLGSRDTVSVRFICLDKDTGKFVSFATQEWWSIEQFFTLFKRFEVVIGQDINEVELEDNNQDLLLR